MEGPPTQPPATPEREPVTYEQALDAVRGLKHAGVENPLSSDDPRVLAELDVLESWYHARNLHLRGVGTAEKAADIVKAAGIFIEAGYDRTEFLKAALEKLRDEHTDAVREGHEEPVRIISAAIDALEERLGARNPKEKPAAILAAKVEEAALLAAQGKAIHAVGVLTLALIDPRFKRLPKAELARIAELRDRYKTGL